MNTRPMPTAVAERSSSMRRLRRRASSHAPQRPYCRTNGCASFLEVNASQGTGTCSICGYTRRLD